MILWCAKCSEYRKRGSAEWDECRYTRRHTMVPANEKITAEIAALRARIEAASRPTGVDLGRLGALEAIKNSQVDDPRSDESTALAVELTIRDGLHVPGGGAFFWIGGPGGWDLVRDNSRDLTDAVSILHQRKYGSSARSYSTKDEIELHAALLRQEARKEAAASGKRAVFDGGTLWVDLGGNPRRIYGISAKRHGPAIRYEPGSRVALERHGAPLPVPKYRRGAWLDRFCSLLRISPDRRGAFAAHLCHMFCTHQATPVMVFEDADGVAACGKTAAARLVREVVDPVGFGRGVMMPPARTADIEEALKSPVLGLDDTGHMSGKAARWITAARRGVVLPNGHLPGYVRVVAAGAGNRDLGRSITYKLPELENAGTPDSLLARLDGMKPHLLHEIFRTIHEAFKKSPGLDGGRVDIQAVVPGGGR